MKIIQTFWTARQDPLKHGFGWTHPEYNLMSWALSCLSLREHYDEVELYTDSAGYHILIEVLQLPYTKTHVIFDDFQCLPHHWALSKIKTYSLQTEPFLHIDGDIYVPNRIPKVIAESPLVAQNREIGTSYYRQMMDKMFAFPTIKFPEYILQRLEDESVASYNMGIFGGTDLDFIHRYCKEACQFLDENHMNDPAYEHSSVWCNIYFEQVIFAVMADMERREVASVLGHPMKDEGYTGTEFCDLARYEQKQFFHLLGGHKRCAVNYEMLEKTLLRLYPQFYTRIMKTFPKRHTIFNQKRRAKTKLSIQMSMAQYEDFLDEKENEYRKIPTKTLLHSEIKNATDIHYLSTTKEDINELCIQIVNNSYIFTIPDNWSKKAIKILREKLIDEENFPLRHIVIIPTIRKQGYKEIPITEHQMKILDSIKMSGGKSKWGFVQNHLFPNSTPSKTTVRKISSAKLLTNKIMTHLVHQGLIQFNN